MLVAGAPAPCQEGGQGRGGWTFKLDHWRVDPSALSREENGHTVEGDYGPDDEGVAYLGNAGEPFDLSTADIVELPNPRFSFCAMMNAAQSEEK